MAAACEGLSDPEGIAKALDLAAEKFDPAEVAEAVERSMVLGAILGATDSLVERESEEEPAEQMATYQAIAREDIQPILMRSPADGRDPFQAAIDNFLARNIVTRDVFDQLIDAAKRKAFTVAGLAAEELLGDAHAELARQIKDSKEKTYFDEETGKWVYKGPNFREFGKVVRDRLEKSGWTPANPSHVETIFRTNTMSAYSSGHLAEMTQPSVLTSRPYWQIRGVNDSRQRPTHRRAQGTILAADHPFWRKAYPPFGFNCRCRVISRSRRWVDAHGGPTRAPTGLPDPGFASGIDASLVPDIDVAASSRKGPQQPTPARPLDPLGTPLPRPPKPFKPLPRLAPSQKSPVVSLPKIPVPTGPQQGMQTGKHVVALQVDKGTPPAVRSRVLGALNLGDLRALEKDPLKALRISKSLGKKKPNGTYTWSLDLSVDEIAVSSTRPASSYGAQFVPGESWSMSSTRATEHGAIETTVHHEFGHRLHVRGGQLVDQAVKEAFGQAMPITRYAAESRREYFAETYAAFRNEPEALRAHDPVGYRLVQKVLDHWGIPHG